MKFLITLLSKYRTKANRKEYVQYFDSYTNNDPSIHLNSISTLPDHKGKGVIHAVVFPKRIIGSLTVRIHYKESFEATRLLVTNVIAYNYHTNIAVSPLLHPKVLANDLAIDEILERSVKATLTEILEGKPRKEDL